MKAVQVGCIAAAIGAAVAFSRMIVWIGGTPPESIARQTLPAAVESAEMPGTLELAAAVPEVFAGTDKAPAAEPSGMPPASFELSNPVPGEIGSASAELKPAVLSDLGLHDAATPVPAALEMPGNVSGTAPPAHDFRYLIYYVWNELPPPQKPADIVLNAFKDIPVGTPIEEIRRAADAFGLDFIFMKAVAKIESGFDPKQRTGSYIGLFQLSKYEFNKFGSGEILDARANAVAAAYKVITEGVLFEWMTHRKPTLSDLYLIHQQGWEGAAEHIRQPDRIAWKSMCATGEGMEKGEKWCKRAIWGNTLPAVKQAWKSVDKLTSAAFVGMWRDRVAYFRSEYMTAAGVEPLSLR